MSITSKSQDALRRLAFAPALLATTALPGCEDDPVEPSAGARETWSRYRGP